MQEKNEFSTEQLSMMLQLVAQKMGKTPEKLTEELKAGHYPDPRVQSVLENRTELTALLESPKVQELLRGMKEKK